MDCAAERCTEVATVSVGNQGMSLWLCRDCYEAFHDLYSGNDRPPVTQINNQPSASDGDDNWCVVCSEQHDSKDKVESHERAAAEYEEKYGVSI